MRRKISPKFHVKNGAKNGKFHAKFTLLGRSDDLKEGRGTKNGREASKSCEEMLCLLSGLLEALRGKFSTKRLSSPILLHAILRLP